MKPVHPLLVQHGVKFKVPPLIEFLKEFSRHFQTGELSMVCYAPSRFGKTIARTYLAESLNIRRQMVVYTATLKKDENQRESRNELWQDLLRSKNGPSEAYIHRPYDVLFNKILVEADELGVCRVLVIIDEAHLLNEVRLSALKKFIDELIDHKLSPFVLLMAQPKILSVPEALKRLDSGDLVDRFYTNMFRLRGLSLDEIEGVLGFYDTTEWPEGSGISYTAHFLPGAWKEGWKLANQASLFKSAFSGLHAQLRMGKAEVGMKFLTKAVRTLFNDIGNAGAAPPDLSKFVTRAAAECGMVNALQIVGDMDAAAVQRQLSVKGGRKALV